MKLSSIIKVRLLNLYLLMQRLVVRASYFCLYSTCYLWGSIMTGCIGIEGNNSGIGTV